MKKWRVDLITVDPETLEERQMPGWEWDGERVRELLPQAADFRVVTWDKDYTPEDGLPFLNVLRKCIVGTFVAATEPYEVEE